MNKNSSEKLYQFLLKILPQVSEHEREELELELDEAVDAMVKGVNGVFTFPSVDPHIIQLVIKALNTIHLRATSVVPVEDKVWITWVIDY